MSNQILNEPWSKLEAVFKSLNDNNISQALKNYKVNEICVDGITSTIHGRKNVQEGCFLNLLKDLGFSDEEIDKVRMCVIGDCKYTDYLPEILNHLIGYHNTPAQNIAKLIPYIKNDNRKLPSKIAQVKYNLSHPQMSTD